MVGSLTFAACGCCAAQFETFSDHSDGRYDNTIYKLSYDGSSLTGSTYVVITWK